MSRNSRGTFKVNEKNKKKEAARDRFEDCTSNVIVWRTEDKQLLKKMQKNNGKRINQPEVRKDELTQVQQSPIKKQERYPVKKREPSENYIEPNKNRTQPVRGKDRKDMTPQQKRERNLYGVYVKRRMPEIRQENPYLKVYGISEILMKEWLNL